MDARIFIEPQQGTTYSEVVTLAQRAEELGFNGFFSSDHYLKMGTRSADCPALFRRGQLSLVWPETPNACGSARWSHR